jgi:transposase
MARSIKKWRENAKEFLPYHTIENLEEMLKKEKKAIVKNRLRACILRKQGFTLEEISFKLSKPLTTIGDWVRRIKNEGLERRHNIKQTGKSAELTEEQLKELEQIIEGSPTKQNIPFKFWTNKLVQYIIEVKFRVKYLIRNVQRLTKKLGFSLQKPRPKNPKANIKKQEEFIEMLKKNFQIFINEDFSYSVLTKPIV